MNRYSAPTAGFIFVLTLFSLCAHGRELTEDDVLTLPQDVSNLSPKSPISEKAGSSVPEAEPSALNSAISASELDYYPPMPSKIGPQTKVQKVATGLWSATKFACQAGLATAAVASVAAEAYYSSLPPATAYSIPYASSSTAGSAFTAVPSLGTIGNSANFARASVPYYAIGNSFGSNFSSRNQSSGGVKVFQSSPLVSLRSAGYSRQSPLYSGSKLSLVDPTPKQHSYRPLLDDSDVYVRGYHRSNGTYVKSHYRSRPNDTMLDNYSTKGNVNPYTFHNGTRALRGL